MGNPVTLYFLTNYVTQEWKDKFIRIFVSLSGVWGGAVKTLSKLFWNQMEEENFYLIVVKHKIFNFYYLGLMAAGDNVDIIVVKPITVRGYQR